MVKNYSTMLAGRKLSVEVGKVAELANAAAMVSYGDTVILATVVASEEPKEGVDFFPLSVNYEEKFYAVGRLPGGFIKRESRPSEKAILTSRVIDRPMRPLFPKDGCESLSAEERYTSFLTSICRHTVLLAVFRLNIRAALSRISLSGMR